MRRYLIATACILVMLLSIQWNPKTNTNQDLTEYLLEKKSDAVFCLPFAYVPDDYLQSTIDLKSGLEVIPYPIQTSSATTQAYFSQGMSFLNHFEWVQAARSFNMAIKSDSNASMPGNGTKHGLFRHE